MKTVGAYFEAKLGRPMQGDGSHPTSECPLNSVVGRECRRAIDAAARVRASIEQAYGSGRDSHPKGRAGLNAVRDAVEDVCICFMCG